MTFALRKTSFSALWEIERREDVSILTALDDLREAETSKVRFSANDPNSHNFGRN